MKLIDLLEKIANDELQDGTEICAKKGLNYTYFRYNRNLNGFNRKRIAKILEIGVNLTDEVEIKEPNNKIKIIEEDKKIEKLETHQDSEGLYFYDKHCKKIYITCDEINFMFEQFNELIDEVNKLKGDKNEK